MWLQHYSPQQFAAPYSHWGTELTLFLCNEVNLARAETASELGRPAAQVLAQPLLDHFGDAARDLNFRQLVGHMLRHLMEARGWVLDQTEVRIPNGVLFTRAARYRRADPAMSIQTTVTNLVPDATTWFFNYFRLRYEVAATLPSTFGQMGDELTPDQHILVGAHLDALAKHWADLCGGPAGHQERMAEFLAQHGGHPCFHRVAGPFLLRYAMNHETKRQKAEPSFISPWVQPIRKASPVKPTGARMCKWDEDRTVADVQVDAGVVAARVPQDWISCHRYGGMLYTGYRCSWVHESSEGLITDRALSRLWDEPHYESMENRRVLVFPGSFLLRTLERAIASFETFCRQNSLVPAP